MRAVKVLLVTLGALAVLLVLVSVVVASLFDPNDYKTTATEAFAARTGRTLTIGQDLKLAYFPWLAIETGDIDIGNAEAFGGNDDEFAHIARVAARVKLLPLLKRRIEIGKVELDGLRLNLARDDESRGNWEDLLPSGDSTAGASSANEAGATPTSFAIEGVHVRDGSVYWRENGDSPRYSVTDLDLDTGRIGQDEPVKLEASLRFKDESSGLAAELRASGRFARTANGALAAQDLTLDTTIERGGGAAARSVSLTADELSYDPATQALRASALTTEAAGVRATWELSGTDLIDNASAEGRVTVESAPLGAVLEALDWPLPAGVEADDLGAFSLVTRFAFHAAPQSVELSELDASALGMTIRGAGTLAGSSLAGNVEIPEFAPGASFTALLRNFVPPTVDVGGLGRLKLTTRFEANLDSGRAALRNLTASVLGASVRADLEAVPGASGNVFRGTVKTSRFPADAFAKTFAALLPPNLSAGELGQIELDARFELDSAADSVTAAPFTAELFGLRASGDVVGRNVSTAARWTGSAKIAEFAPQDLLRRFGLPPQPTSDPKAFTRATIDTRFAVDKSKAELTDVVLALDESRITGQFTLEGFDAPKYRFALNVDRVDADRYLPPKARDAKEGEATAGDIELPQNNTMQLDGTMQIGALRLAGLDFQNVSSRIAIDQGDMRLTDARAKLYGGEFNGNFNVRASGTEPGLALDGRAANLDLAPLIEGLTGEPANFSGRGAFDLDLAGKGRTIIANVGSAAGKVSFKLSDGAIKGFNLGRSLCAAYNTKERLPPPQQQPKETVYQSIAGTATVSAGTAKSEDLLARTSFMDIYGGGTLALVAQRLDYELDAKLTGSIEIEGCQSMDGFIGDRLPFKINGTVADPAITPDFSKLIQRKLRDEVQDKLKDKLRGILR